MPDTDWMQSHEPVVRLTIFASVMTVMALLEAVSPSQPRGEPRSRRWLVNLGLGALSSVLLRIVLPGATVLMAVWAEMRGWGVLNLIAAPDWIEIGIAYLLLDLAMYVQHVATHLVPILWRFHRIHHADREVDVSTALRFHPVEILLSQIWKMGLVIALGASPVAVIFFEIVLNAAAIFNHANLRLGPLTDRIVRAFIVTPDMHRIHHSERVSETNSNYGNNLVFWDRMFGSYRSTAQDRLVIGLPELHRSTVTSLRWCLVVPFWKDAA